ncbi:hypothetical protein HYC85_018314 [Camellia sinensis]|uniref:Uncharacterized protein n=1 Tax=Camellia sinensis TaxID=4442 RepID=A0A7J7GUX5_CAMSI|nr:hypothetical protein HYC85_018314 [Camellia sinensis]
MLAMLNMVLESLINSMESIFNRSEEKILIDTMESLLNLLQMKYALLRDLDKRLQDI